MKHFFVVIGLFMGTCSAQAQWTQMITGMTNQSIGALYADTTTLYAGSITSVFKSTNLGVNWTSSSSGLPTFTNFYSIVRSGNYLVAAGDAAGIWRSSNSGATWVQTTSGVPANQYATALYAEGNSVYAAFGFTSAFGISTDNGATWTKTANGLPTTQTMTGVAKIGTNLFICHQNLGVYISTDGGTSWASDPGVISSQNKNALIASGNSLIVGVSGASTQSGIFLSTDLGTTWTKVRTGPSVYGLSKNGSTVYAVGDSIDRSTNDGQSWTPADITGLPGSIWNTLQIAGTFAFVNYFGVGVYRRPVSELTDVDNEVSHQVPANYNLEQNYPNPFNPVTNIRFQIPETRFVTLKVYNVLGQEVATLVNDLLQGGDHRAEFNARNLPSGMYLYRLHAGEFTDAKRLIILK